MGKLRTIGHAWPTIGQDAAVLRRDSLPAGQKTLFPYQE
jgi:hypothetical protein